MARRRSVILGRGLLVACLLAAPGAAGQPAGGTQRLAFVADREGAQDLHLLDVTRLTTTRLASGHSQIDTPVWAPDGSRLAFASTSGAASSIFVVNYARHYHIETIDPAGGSRQRLTAQAGPYGLLTWSP